MINKRNMLLVTVICYLNLKKNLDKTNKLSKLITSDKYKNRDFIVKRQNSMYDQFAYISNFLTQNNIRYFIVAGTLLGTARNNSIISYDNDIDIGIFIEDYNKIYNLMDKMVGPCDIKIRKKSNSKEKRGFSYGCVDIFTFSKYKKTNEYRYHYKGYRNCYYNEFFYQKELSNLKLYNFGNLKVYGPNDIDQVAKRTFGKSYKKNFKVKLEKIHKYDPLVNLPKKLIVLKNLKQVLNFKYIYNYIKYSF